MQIALDAPIEVVLPIEVALVNSSRKLERQQGACAN